MYFCVGFFSLLFACETGTENPIRINTDSVTEIELPGILRGIASLVGCAESSVTYFSQPESAELMRKMQAQQDLRRIRIFTKCKGNAAIAAVASIRITELSNRLTSLHCS